MSRPGPKRGKRLPGAEFSWDSDPGGEPDTAPTPLFPKYTVPRVKKLTQRERKQVDLYRSLREKIHDGPFYAVLAGPLSSGSRAKFDPFQGMATYGQKYQKKTRTVPELNSRPYVMNFFPKELWPTLDPKYVGLSASSTGGSNSLKARQKRRLEDEEQDEEEDEIHRRRPNVGDEDEDGSEAGENRKAKRNRDEEDNLGDDEEQGEDEIVDDDFEEDEEDMGGDYNAEQYFDGGDEDGDGYDGGGDDNDTY